MISVSIGGRLLSFLVFYPIAGGVFIHSRCDAGFNARPLVLAASPSTRPRASFFHATEEGGGEVPVYQQHRDCTGVKCVVNERQLGGDEDAPHEEEQPMRKSHRNGASSREPQPQSPAASLRARARARIARRPKFFMPTAGLISLRSRFESAPSERPSETCALVRMNPLARLRLFYLRLQQRRCAAESVEAAFGFVVFIGV